MSIQTNIEDMKILIVHYSDIRKDSRLNRLHSTLVGISETKLLNPNLMKKSKNCNTRVSRFFCIVRFNIFARKFIKKNVNEYDLFIISDYTSTLSIYKIGKRILRKTLYDCYELYLPFDKTIISFRFHFFHFFESFAIRNSQEIITASYERSLILLGYYKLKTLPTEIKNIGTFNDELISFPQIKINETINVVYFGDINSNRGLDELIIQLRNKSDIILDIYGDGHYFTDLQNLINKDEVSNIKLWGSFNHSEIYNILKNKHIGFLNYKNSSLNNIFCSPNKIYEYAQFGIPIICNTNITLVKTVEENGIGLCSDNYYSAIKSIISNYETFQNNIVKFNIKYNWKDESKKLTKVIKSFI